MFSKSSKSNVRETRSDASSTKSVPSIISSDLSIAGDLSSTGEIQVDGTIEGDIRCGSLIVGVKGTVIGQVRADSVRLHGKVTGLVHAKTVFLASTARMVGDITHESLAIEPGAFLEGHCRRMVEETSAVALVEADAELTKVEAKVEAPRKPELVSDTTPRVVAAVAQ